MHSPNQFIASQNLPYGFFKWISNVIFPPISSVFEAHFQEPSTLESQDCNGYPCIKSWVEKSQSFIFKIRYIVYDIYIIWYVEYGTSYIICKCIWIYNIWKISMVWWYKDIDMGYGMGIPYWSQS